MADFWMDDLQIEVSYKTAMDRVAQIKVLAELNDAKPKDIVKILKRRGVMTDEEAKDSLIELGKMYNSRGISEELDAFCREKYGEGYSDKAIAKMIGASDNAVKYWRRKSGLPANDPSKSLDGRWWYKSRFDCKAPQEVKP